MNASVVTSTLTPWSLIVDPQKVNGIDAVEQILQKHEVLPPHYGPGGGNEYSFPCRV
jgi:hypothetical protein